MDAATNTPARDERLTSSQAGALSFTELVRAHHQWERGGAGNGGGEERYQQALTQFQAAEGELMHAYWATKQPSAVALTLKPRRRLKRMLTDDDYAMRLHRVTDWLARDSKVADLLHHCDTLAIKVSEVLRGTPERIAMQWIYAVESHLLGFIERTPRPDEKEVDEVCERQAAELVEIERYYARAATKATRIVYFWGMVIGTAAAGVIGLALATFLWSIGSFEEPHTRGAQTFFVCFTAGAVGAFVSVLMRMSSNTFRVDYEVGRSTIRRLGSFRPLIGSIFGMALYFLVLSGMLRIQLPASQTETFFFMGSLAFLAGFNERWTNVILGQAEQTVAASLGGATTTTTQKRDDTQTA